MTEQHPITPPPELVQLWLENYFGCWDDVTVTVADASSYIATQTSQWIHEQRGADIQKARDEELEACCEWLDEYLLAPKGAQLRDARRSNPPSLKEQALAVVENSAVCDHVSIEHADILRRALEALDD